jgi:uncharacterized caspase-like protein
MRRILSAVVLVVATLFAAPAWAQQTIALVIGISDYKVGGKLPQTLVDAGRVAAALTEVGFSTQTLVNPALSKSELEDALLDFSVKAERADVAVLYFAGHGMQYDNDNWLIPASAELRSEVHIRVQAVPLTNVIELMRPARFRIVILDACRNNPFVVNWGKERSSGDGLARLPEGMMPIGSMVAFSAAAGKKVPDNGVYAEALAKWIKSDGLELRQMMERVRSDVQQKTPTAAPEYMPRYDGAFTFKGSYEPNAVVAGQPALSATERKIVADADKAAAQGDEAALRARNAESRAKQAAMSQTACRNEIYAGECPAPGAIVYGQFAWTQASASDGESYAGQLRDNVRLLGVFSYPVSRNTVARYEGEWKPVPTNKAGERYGFGVMVYQNGDRLRGSFVNGAAHGFAVLDRIDRSRVAGRWDMGVPVDAVAWDSDGRRTTPTQ